MANKKSNNKKKIKLPPLELNPYNTRPGAKTMYAGGRLRYNEGGTYYASGATQYNTNFVDQNEVMRESTQGTETMAAVGDTVKQGVSTAIPIAGLFTGIESMGTGIAESTGKTETDKNYNKRVSEGLFDPFTSQVNMWADDDISTMDKIGATLLGGWGASGHHLAKAENKRYSDEVMKQMFTEERNEFAEAPKTMYADGGSLDAPMGMPSGKNLDYNEFEGLSHEQGGIPLGPDAEVEGGEVRVEDYIFSDQLENPLTKKTFAEEAKRIKKKYEGRLNDAPSNRAMTKELERLRVANDMARELKEAEQQSAEQEVDAMLAQDMASTGTLDAVGEASMSPEQVMPPAMDNEMDMPLEETPVEQFRDGGNLDSNDPVKAYLQKVSPSTLNRSKEIGAVGKQYEKDSEKYNELLQSTLSSLNVDNIDEYEHDFEFYESTASPSAYHTVGTYLRKKPPVPKPRPEEKYFLREPNSAVLTETDRLGYQKANPASKIPRVTGDVYEGLSGLEGINAYKDASGKTVWLDREAKGLYELDENQQRIPFTPTPKNTDTAAQAGNREKFNNGGIFKSKSERDAKKIARKNAPADSSSNKYGEKNWFESEEGGGSAFSLPLIPAIKKAREVNKMIRDEELDYAKIKPLSYFNRPQEVAKFANGGGFDPFAYTMDSIYNQFNPPTLPVRNPGQLPTPQGQLYNDNPTLPTLGASQIDNTQGKLINPYQDDTPITMSNDRFQLSDSAKGQLMIPSEEDYANTRDAIMGSDDVDDGDPKKQGSNFFNQDMAALGFSNLAALDNLINSRNIEKSKMPEVTLDRVSYADARADMTRGLGVQQAIGQKNIARQSTTAGQQLSNQTAQTAALANAQVSGFMQSYGAENAANAQIGNQEKMYNVNALKESVIANEQNRAAGKNARQVALADIGQNVPSYIRDQKAEQRNNDYNELQFKLIDQYYPNYSLMTPEERANADFKIAQWIKNPNIHFQP